MHHKQGEAEDSKGDADRVYEIDDCAAFFLLGPAACPLFGRNAMLFLHLSGHDADARRAKVSIRHRSAVIQGDPAGNHEPDQTDYAAFTYYTGFKVNSGEYKVMGLAPYGDPSPPR